MSDDIEPALTAEEWALGRFLHAGHGVGVEAAARHARAALALHDQPYGFTWDDVDGLIIAARLIGRDNEQGLIVSSLRLTADRIAALLPPRC